ncbi:MAG: hypothetical protein FD171_325 [Actinobacteria bacterium]|nr:MAG: hypothetical protein FD171_325 [Actinomycetota bacterium]MDO8950300.1 hypothetical protein [Actinomycetota bacterium]
MRRSFTLVLVATAFVLTTLSATVAFAAPVAWQSIDVTLHSESAESRMLVSGTLPETVSLPAEAELSVPAGSAFMWIGEILGGDPSADPELKYTKTTIGELDVYRFTLTKSRTAQVEIPAPIKQVINGSAYTLALKWTSAQDVPEVRLIARVPQGAQVAAPVEGAALQPGEAGYSYYVKTIKGVKAGQPLDLTFDYTLPAVPATAATPGTNPIVPLVLVLFVIAVAALVVVSVRRKPAEESSDGEQSVITGAADTQVEFSDEEQFSEASPETQLSRPAGASKRMLITAVVIGTLIVAAFIVVGQTTKPKLVGDTITRTFSPGEPCLTSTLAVTAPKNADPNKTAEKLFGALGPLGGMNIATYNVKTQSVEVGFCESKTSEAAVRQALAATGLVAAEAPAP